MPSGISPSEHDGVKHAVCEGDEVLHRDGNSDGQYTHIKGLFFHDLHNNGFPFQLTMSLLYRIKPMTATGNRDPCRYADKIINYRSDLEQPA